MSLTARQTAFHAASGLHLEKVKTSNDRKKVLLPADSFAATLSSATASFSVYLFRFCVFSTC